MKSRLKSCFYEMTWQTSLENIYIALILFSLSPHWIKNEPQQYHPCSINLRVCLIKNSSLNLLSKAICQWTVFACLSKFQSKKSVSFSAKDYSG